MASCTNGEKNLCAFSTDDGIFSWFRWCGSLRCARTIQPTYPAMVAGRRDFLYICERSCRTRCSDRFISSAHQTTRGMGSSITFFVRIPRKHLHGLRLARSRDLTATSCVFATAVSNSAYLVGHQHRAQNTTRIVFTSVPQRIWFQEKPIIHRGHLRDQGQIV